MIKNYDDLYNFASSVMDLSKLYFDELSAFEARLRTYVPERVAEEITSLIDRNDITLEMIMDMIMDNTPKLEETKSYTESEDRKRKAELLSFIEFKLRHEPEFLRGVFPELKQMTYEELQMWAIREDIIDPPHE